MSQSIDEAFIKQFESEVHLAYQRMSSKLRGMVRTQPNVVGKSTTFQKIGKGEAGKKDRHGHVPVMNLEHSNVECPMVDSYAGEWIDRLDLLKINIDERQAIAQSIAGALGRREDRHITSALDTNTTNQTSATGGLTLEKVKEVFVAFGNKDVPDDGRRYASVSHKGWSQLMELPEFSEADYIGYDELPYKGGMTAKRWFGFMWFAFSGLTLDGGTRWCHAWHYTAVGSGYADQASIDMDWQGTHHAWFTTGTLSMGAVVIDEDGLYKIRITE